MSLISYRIFLFLYLNELDKIIQENLIAASIAGSDDLKINCSLPQAVKSVTGE